MKQHALLRDKRFVLIASLMLVFSILVTVSRIVLAEQLQTITIINDAASVFSSLVATLFFVNVWVSISRQDISKKIWGQIVAGMLAWTVAETIWAYYEVILEQDVPYPSVADAFWFLGYFIFYVALVNQYRIFQTSPTRQQKTTMILLVIVFSVIVGILVLKPIVESFDFQKRFESLLNIAYPLSDLVLLTLTLAIIFSLQQGRFVLTWHLVGVGLLLMAAGDLIFSYASWNELYYPDGHLNALTILIDMLYFVAYLILGLGAYTYRITADLLQPVQMGIVLRSLTKSNILIFIDENGRIISLSDNFVNLVRSSSAQPYVKMYLSDVLKIDPAVMTDLIKKTLAQGSLSTHPVEMQGPRGKLITVWITSLSVHDDQGQFVCIALVLRANLNLERGEEKPLSQEQQMLVNYYLTQAGTYRNEENQVLKAYILEQIRLLYSLVQQFSGTSVADKLLTYLNQVGNQNGWQFTFSAQEICIPEEYEGEILAGHASILLKEAKTFAVNTINLKIVEQEMMILDSNLSRDNLRYIDKYNLRRDVVH